MKNIALVCGGFSSEYEISLQSALNIKNALGTDTYNIVWVEISKEKWIAKADAEYPIDKNDFSFTDKAGDKHCFDLVLNAIHGTPGEDGKLCAFFDMLQIPYTSGGVLNLALTFDKFYCNSYLKQFGVVAPANYLVRKVVEINVDEIIQQVGLPCFVKPNNGGSSCGTTKVKHKNQLMSAIEIAMREDNGAIVEEYIAGTEITCGVYKSNEKNIVFPLTEIVSKNEFFDYESKYDPTKADEITPARISTELRDKCMEISSYIYDLLHCRSVVRMDYIIKNNVFYFLEVNTVPGMTQNSLVPKMIKAYGMSFKEFFFFLIEATSI